jgi:hypothetical protein
MQSAGAKHSSVVGAVLVMCNQGDIVPSDQMIVYLPATDTRQSGELIGRITFQNSLAVSNELLLPCRPAISVRPLTDPY